MARVVLVNQFVVNNSRWEPFFKIKKASAEHCKGFSLSGRSRAVETTFSLVPKPRDSTAELLPPFVFFGINQLFNKSPAFLALDKIFPFDCFCFRIKTLSIFELPRDARLCGWAITLIMSSKPLCKPHRSMTSVVLVNGSAIQNIRMKHSL